MGNKKAESVEALRRKFIFNVAVCLGILVVVHLAPVAKTDHNSFRFYCTVVYFGALVVLCFQMLKPRTRLIEMMYADRFKNCPPTFKSNYQEYLYALNRLLDSLVYVVLATIIFIALDVFTADNIPNPDFSLSKVWNFVAGRSSYTGLPYHAWWQGCPSGVKVIITWGYRISMAALLLFPYFMSGPISEVLQRRRQLEKQSGLQDTTPLAQDEKPVRVLTERSFRAGQFEWAWDDLTKNCIVMGQTGSGKTVCVLNALLDGMMGASSKGGLPASALVLDPKGDFAGKLKKICAKYGRSSDFLMIDPAVPDQSIRWNPFDSTDDELELSARFAAVLETQGMKNEQDSFWVDSAKKFIRHSIALIRLTNPSDAPPSFSDIAELATNMEAIGERTNALDVMDSRCDSCLAFFANEWVKLPDETRASIQAYISNMTDPFLMPPYSTMFSGQSTVRIESMINTGKILYVNMPVADKEAMSRMICAFVKLEYFREVLKARDKKRPSFFLCDEFQVYFTTTQGKGDADFFERSRQSNHANIIAVQNLPALKKKSPKEDFVMNLLGNCAMKVFLRNTDPGTNEWASKLFGQMLVDKIGESYGGGGGKRSFSMLGAQISVSKEFDQKVRQERFVELSIPSKEAGIDYAETIIHAATRVQTDQLEPNYRWKVHPI